MPSDPALTGLTVTYNGDAWTEGDNYTYDAATGTFATIAGQITVPAATYTQETDGTYTVTPAPPQRPSPAPYKPASEKAGRLSCFFCIGNQRHPPALPGEK
ncbi:MAG: hypothetical protein ACLU38_01820 [Dysosmobacter sp.]